MLPAITTKQRELAALCVRHGIQRLSVFGSAARGELGPDSDIDVLVEFDADRSPGLITLAGIEHELSGLLGGRKVDINTPLTLSRYFKDEVLRDAEVMYVQT